MDSGSGNEATRLWRVYRTAHQMVHDRVSELYYIAFFFSSSLFAVYSLEWIIKYEKKKQYRVI